MSRSVDLFIDSDAAITDLAHSLAVLTGASADGGPDGTVRIRRGEVTCVLFAHDFVDDGALRLSRFRYDLAARFHTDGPLADVPEVAFIRQTADLVRQRMDTRAMVVVDLEQRDPAPGAGVSEEGDGA